MSEIKQKPNKKKSKGGGPGKKGVRHPELHDRGARAIQPPRPVRPKSSAMAAPVRRLVTLAKIEVGPWGRNIELDREQEETCVTALLSDGRMVTRWPVVTYQRGEREIIMKAMTQQRTSQREDIEVNATLKRIIARRSFVIQQCVGELEREFARGIAA